MSTKGAKRAESPMSTKGVKRAESQCYSTVVPTLKNLVAVANANYDLADDTRWTVINYKSNRPRMKGLTRKKQKGARKGKADVDDFLLGRTTWI